MTVLLIAVLGPLLAVLLVRWYRADSQRQAARRKALTVLSRASRARSLDECPPEFLADLRAALRLDETEEVA
jgi:hypothetical protein